MSATMRESLSSNFQLPNLSVEDYGIVLAIELLRARILRLCKEDQDDLYELLPCLFRGDDDERRSAIATMQEILDQEKSNVVKSDMTSSASKELQNWIAFTSSRIREARRKSGMTQKELSEASGIPQSHISRLEAGQHSPTSKTLNALAKALNVPASTFDPSAE